MISKKRGCKCKNREMCIGCGEKIPFVCFIEPEEIGLGLGGGINDCNNISSDIVNKRAEYTTNGPIDFDNGANLFFNEVNFQNPQFIITSCQLPCATFDNFSINTETDYKIVLKIRALRLGFATTFLKVRRISDGRSVSNSCTISADTLSITNECVFCVKRSDIQHGDIVGIYNSPNDVLVLAAQIVFYSSP